MVSLRELYLHDNCIQGPLPPSVLPAQLRAGNGVYGAGVPPSLGLLSVGANLSPLLDTTNCCARPDYLVAERAFQFEEEHCNSSTLSGSRSDGASSSSMLRATNLTVLQ